MFLDQNYLSNVWDRIRVQPPLKYAYTKLSLFLSCESIYSLLQKQLNRFSQNFLECFTVAWTQLCATLGRPQERL